MPAGHVQQIVILIFPPPETCHPRPAFLLLSSEPHPCAVDSRDRFFVICDYTGKEVVGCKLQIVIVVPDQVRWLRLRAVALILWGVPVDPLVGGNQGHLSKRSVSM